MTDDSTKDYLRKARQLMGEKDFARARDTLEELYWSQEAVEPEVAAALCELSLVDANLEAAIFWASELAPHANRPGTGAGALLDGPLRRAPLRLPLREQAAWCDRLDTLFPEHPGVKRARRRVAEERKRLHRPVLLESKSLRRQGQHAQAALRLQEALERWPDDAWLLNELAQVRFEEGRTDEAAALHLKALEARPNDACAANNLGKIALGRGDVREARDWFLAVLDVHPSDLHAMMGLGRCALADHDEAGAATWFERILRLRPDDPAAQTERRLLAERQERTSSIERGRSLRRAGAYPEARALLLRTLALDATHPDVLAELGWTCLEWGRPEEAEGWFVRALVRDPAHPQSAEGLNRAREVLLQGAATVLQVALTADNPLDLASRIWPGHDAVLNELGHPPDGGFYEPADPFRIIGELPSPPRRTGAPSRPAEAERLLGLGRQTARLGRLEEADGWLRKAIDAAPELPGPLVACGDLARLRGDLPRACRLYRQALQVHPSYKGALLGLAMAEMKRRHVRQARSWIEAVLDRDPADARASALLQRLQLEEEVLQAVGRSRCLRSSGDLAQARRKVRHALDTFGPHPDLMVEGALVSAGVDARPEARELLARALQLEPDNLVALNLLAVFILEGERPAQTELEQAERLLRRALGLRNDNPVTLNNLGRLELARNRPEDAARWYRQVLAVTPDSPRALEGLGEIAFRQGRLEEARHWIEKAWWAEDKDRPRLLTTLARVCTALGDTAAARRHLDAALDLAPDDVRVMTSLAYVALLEENTEEAQLRLQGAFEKRPGDEKVLNLLGRVAQARGDFAEARRLYAETLALHPASVRAFLGLAWTAFEDRNLTEALHWFDQALRLEPDNPHALTGAGVVKARMGDYDEAQECYRASLKWGLHPPALWHWFRMATLEGRGQQLSWFLDAASGNKESGEVRAEVSAWKERMARGARIRREGGDIRAFLADIARSLPRRYRATTPEPFPA